MRFPSSSSTPRPRHRYWLLIALVLITLLPTASAIAARIGVSPAVEVSGPGLHSSRIAVGPGIALTAPPSAPTEYTGPLSVSVDGQHLVNGGGQPIALHGVNISGTEWRCLDGQAFAGPSDDASIAAIQAWRVNAVRIPLNESCWLGINGAPVDPDAYREAIHDYVERLHARRIYAILDLHWSAAGEEKARSAQAMANADHSTDFWTSVASYFKEDNAVLFDLYNEPRDISWSCWRDGCDGPGFRVTGMQQLIDAVRATGARQPVMVGGLGWATQLGQAWLQNRPNDPAGQMVAAVHLYDQRDVGYFNGEIGSVARQLPVVVGEIGQTDCAHDALDAFLPWADTRGISYVAWAWYVGDCARYPSLISDYGGTPTSFGIGYRDHLLASFAAAHLTLAPAGP